MFFFNPPLLIAASRVSLLDEMDTKLNDLEAKLNASVPDSLDPHLASSDNHKAEWQQLKAQHQHLAVFFFLRTF